MSPRLVVPAAVVVVAIGLLAYWYLYPSEGASEVPIKAKIELPKPLELKMSVSEALKKRRSIREYRDESITLRELATVLWAAQGITDPRGFRTAPSAGALYPLRVFVVVRKVEGLAPGIYVYDPKTHTLGLVRRGNFTTELQRACLDQEWVGHAAVDLVIVGYERVLQPRYGERSFRYMALEAGHVGQNIYLACTALGLGTVAVGAFYDDRVKEILGITEGDAVPLYVFPIGRR
ncbi:SagB/ThcOx family dehydrogenase [Methanopyrus kandleri]|uniref:Nitroreductase n=2 Tax=Methanopyrus kandleri TaxID=2320 RepID=Q8TVA2_METKA|nr:SagB/ThcOx family dehydrogenase [Methanopyrus kandleri]AAM02703.1 Nitroreductase [Methanopyrus kandleri AV19]HII70960.1 SagB/ThcOx family dehydrogenase [Methanopyrus kandleri]